MYPIPRVKARDVASRVQEKCAVRGDLGKNNFGSKGKRAVVFGGWCCNTGGEKIELRQKGRGLREQREREALIQRREGTTAPDPPLPNLRGNRLQKHFI